jgi:hypothetical protein
MEASPDRCRRCSPSHHRQVWTGTAAAHSPATAVHPPIPGKQVQTGAAAAHPPAVSAVTANLPAVVVVDAPSTTSPSSRRHMPTI